MSTPPEQLARRQYLNPLGGTRAGEN